MPEPLAKRRHEFRRALLRAPLAYPPSGIGAHRAQAVKAWAGPPRRLEPGLWDYELAYGPVVDELAPDLIHANDFRMIGVGARAKIRADAKGRRIASGPRPFHAGARCASSPDSPCGGACSAVWCGAVVTLVGRLTGVGHPPADTPGRDSIDSA